jgi:hypothetical protein
VTRARIFDATAAPAPIGLPHPKALPAILRQYQFTTITRPGSRLYEFDLFDNVPALLTGLTASCPGRKPWPFQGAVQTRETEALQPARADRDEGGESGQFVYDAASRALEIPSYPARLVNPIGAGDAFCGGFLSKFCRTYDPSEAALYGNISASLVVEGHDPL